MSDFPMCFECGQHPEECRCVPVGYAMTAPTPREELVEKVARAIYDSARSMMPSLPTWGFADSVLYAESGLTLRGASVREAVAALAVVAEDLREPSEAMISAAYRTEGHSHSAAAIWNAMLAASPLGDKP